LEAWAWQLNNLLDNPIPSVAGCLSRSLLLDYVKSRMLEGEPKVGRKPRVLIIGALGRCGTSAVDPCKQADKHNENTLQWDLLETRAMPGPYEEVSTSDIFVN
jgi:saccharopine dehydrogenase (NAD+, L-lysine-forming)